jgi:hypothetical protein
MCPPSKPKVPDVKPVEVPVAAPPPPPPEPVAEAPVVEDFENNKNRVGSALANARKGGTKSLRVSLNTPQPGGAGLNVPRL